MFDVVVIGGGIVGSAIAAGLVKRGASVALIDSGPEAIAAQSAAVPSVHCGRRQHLGCVSARNHVLGGNAHYWGGGLMRPPGQSLADCIGANDFSCSDATIDLGRHFQSVERELGISIPPGRDPLMGLGLDDGQYQAADICVLPGSTRNVAKTWLDSLRQTPQCEVVAPAKLLAFKTEDMDASTRKVREVAISHRGEQRLVAGHIFVLAAGAVDTNIIVQQFANQFRPAVARDDLGRRMHDHWSVPIAKIRLTANDALRALLAPRFREGLIVGRHFEMKGASGWGARGFLHFTFAFDELSPYREIRQLMLLRQQHAPLPQLITGLLPLVPRAPMIARIGLEKMFKRRLYLAGGLQVTATLDFESFPHRDNVLRLSGDQVEFDWDISQEDEEVFLGLLVRYGEMMRALERHFPLSLEPLFDPGNHDEALVYLHQAASDTFHLGGGLAVGGNSGALDSSLRLRGTENLYAISTAAFARPGIVNPTHCLLALADRFVTQQRREH